MNHSESRTICRAVTLSIALILCVQSGLFAFQESIVPLKRAHAHNDYQHKRPLLDALERGFCSAEADVFLVDGELLVAHTKFWLHRERTLESMYLKPLHELAQNNNGQIFKNQTFTLLIDFKEKGNEIYPVLKKQLEKYRSSFSGFTNGKYKKSAIQIVISGSRPKKLIINDNDRLVGIDGRPSELDSDLPAEVMPLISDQWSSQFKWRGRGEFPEDYQKKLESIVQRAHKKGRRVRFWATPEKEAVWQVLLDADVDLINTDKLDELKNFLLKSDAKKNRTKKSETK